MLPRCQYRFCKEHFLRGLLILLDTAVAEVELLVRFLLREEKVDAEGLGAELVLRVEDLNLYIHDVAPLAHDRGLKRDVTPLVWNLRKTTQLLISSASVA